MFYSIIEQLCSQNGIRISNLCDALGMSRGNIARWRKGSVPNAQTLESIAAYFHVTTDFLLSGRVKPAQEDGIKLDEITYALYNETGKLSDEHKQMLLDMARMLVERQAVERQRSEDGSRQKPEP